VLRSIRALIALARYAGLFLLFSAGLAIPAFLFIRLGFLAIGVIWHLGWGAVGASIPPDLDLVEHLDRDWLIWLSLGVGAGVCGAKGYLDE
jgi:hypothetical protein